MVAAFLVEYKKVHGARNLFVSTTPQDLHCTGALHCHVLHSVKFHQHAKHEILHFWPVKSCGAGTKEVMFGTYQNCDITGVSCGLPSVFT